MNHPSTILPPTFRPTCSHIRGQDLTQVTVLTGRLIWLSGRYNTVGVQILGCLWIFSNVGTEHSFTVYLCLFICSCFQCFALICLHLCFIPSLSMAVNCRLSYCCILLSLSLFVFVFESATHIPANWSRTMPIGLFNR